jgi:hypothetical protein
MSVKDDVQVAARYITPRSLLIFGLIAAVVFAYCEGKRSERAAVQSARYEQQRTIIVDSAAVVHDSENAHTVELIERRDDATKARATHAKIAARLVPASETTIRVDGGEPQTMVPANLVVPEIKAAHAALVSDSLALLAAAATLGFATTRADLNEQRAEAAEGELKASKPSRWRFVAGVLTGVASVILLRRALK